MQQQQNVNVNALETTTPLNPRRRLVRAPRRNRERAPPQLQTTNATLGGTLEAEMYSALPVEIGTGSWLTGSAPRDRLRIFAARSARQSNQRWNTTTNSGIVNGVGSRGGAIAIYVNGVPFTNVSGEGDPTIWSGRQSRWML